MIESTFSLTCERQALHATLVTGRECSRDPYILFLHGGGAGTSSQGTRYLQEALAREKVPSLAFDFSGHGRSDGRMESSGLKRRHQEACLMAEHMNPLRVRAVVGTSMGGHTACQMLQVVNPDVLILFCPAAYERAAEEVKFGEDFRRVIRSTQQFSDSPAFEPLRKFQGHVLIFYGSEDMVIPDAVKESYASCAQNAKGVQYVKIRGAEHKLHRWLELHEAESARVIAQVMRTLDLAPP